MDNQDIKKIVREGYAKTAKQESSCCSSTNSCCGAPDLTENISKKIGYSNSDLHSVPEGANLGLGCGNPVALASLKEGETVLDLGAGAGFDCFLAAQRVGKKGRIIGVDMTPEMVEKAQVNAEKGQYHNVEFKLGDIEKLPVDSLSVDVIISNCVINLSPDKEHVFTEAFRVLKPGGRLMISDIVLLNELPEFIKNNAQAYIGCVSGAILKDSYINLIKKAGFKDVQIIDEVSFPLDSLISDSTIQAFFGQLKDKDISIESILESVSSVKSIKVRAIK